MSIEERRESLLKQLNMTGIGPLKDGMEYKIKGLPNIIEDFENTKIENKGVLSIGEYSILTLKNMCKQVSYVYKEGALIGKHTSNNEYTILPSSTKGLFETYTLLGNGRWIIAAFNECAKYVNHRYSSPVGMRVE